MAGDSASIVIIWLALLFLTSMGEAYFPDIMNINTLRAKANWMFIADAMGNALTILVPTGKSWNEVQVFKAVVPAICDIISKVFILGGIALSSAQTKSILYNSCIVWSALLSRVVLRRRLSLGQWAGVAFLIMGLSIKINFAGGDSGMEFRILGMISILIGCALHSLTNVVNEYYIRQYGFPPSKLCSLIGFVSLAFWCLLLSSGFIIPEMDGGKWIFSRSDFSVLELSKWSHETPMTNGLAWLGFVVSSAVHALAYFNLLGSVGVVSCGVMKGLTTAGYVALSAVVLCDSDGSIKRRYCMTERTAASAIACVAGVLVYTYFTKASQTKDALLTIKDATEGCATVEIPQSSFAGDSAA